MASGTILIKGLVACSVALGQVASFDVASVKPSPSVVGHDGVLTTDPIRFSARNATLKRLIVEAYQVPYSQIAAGPGWVGMDEYDIDARAASPASLDQLRLMLRTLLKERFKLAIHNETRDRPVYNLTVTKDGPRLSSARPGDARTWRFHGDLNHFADRLAVQLTIPFNDDPTVPSHASGTPTPVVNATGIAGVYDIAIDFKPEPGVDPFTYWQRVLEEQLGLKLEARKAPVVFLVVEHAEKAQTDGN